MRHPAVSIALRFLDVLGMKKLQDWKNEFEKCNEDNIVAKQCKKTIEEMIEGKVIDDIDIIGLAWLIRFNLYETIKELKEKDIELKKRKIKENKTNVTVFK